jgi:hypothetical protein
MPGASTLNEWLVIEVSAVQRAFGERRYLGRLLPSPHGTKPSLQFAPSSDGFSTKACRFLLTGTAGGEAHVASGPFGCIVSKKSAFPKRLFILIAPALLSFRATGILLHCQHE